MCMVCCIKFTKIIKPRRFYYLLLLILELIKIWINQLKLNVNTRYADGTLDVVPQMFGQMFTIHGIFGRECQTRDKILTKKFWKSYVIKETI